MHKVYRCGKLSLVLYRRELHRGEENGSCVTECPRERYFGAAFRAKGRLLMRQHVDAQPVVPVAP